MTDNIRFDKETGDYFVDMELSKEEVDSALMMVPAVRSYLVEKGDLVMSATLRADLIKALDSDLIDEKLRGIINTCIVAMLQEEEEGLFDDEGHEGEA